MSRPVSIPAAARCLLAALALLPALLLPATGALADDTEIYRAAYSSGGGTARPKVLIIFDNSGSMDTIAEQKPAYNPATTYPTVTGIVNGRLYWATGSSGDPPPADTGQWINDYRNRCASSYTPLTSTGFFQSRLAMWRTATVTSWSDLATSTTDPLHVDCSNDVTNSNNGNGSGTGNPGSGYPRSSTPRPYGSTRQSNVSGGWSSYRLYNANYMNWFYSTTLVDRSRIDVAQSVTTDLINANPDIDFGLAVFNYNGSGSGSNDGGAIVRRIIADSSSGDRSGLVSLVNSLTPDNFTPLCETTYEAYRYLSGQTTLYARERGSSTPSKDAAAESPSGTYDSPTADCEYIYIILMTDGEPTYDTDANSRIESLTGRTCGTYRNGFGDNEKNCLPEIAEYMYANDLDGNVYNGQQKAITYTIGFTTNQTLLSTTAQRGGGLYYTTDTAEGLASAFQGAITSILATNSTFTSPSVAVNTFTRTESRNEVFFAMFTPQTGTEWPGNIKKLAISISGGTASLTDANGRSAIDASTGEILGSAQTFWSATTDGPQVNAGGVGGLLAVRAPDTRVIKTNTGTGGALQDFSAANFTAAAMGVAALSDVYTLFNVASAGALSDLIDWGRGYTDATRADTRDWVLGDMLHSRPLVLNYGARSGFTSSSPDIRMVVGTNAGFLHMFRNDTGAESWAFFPKELAAVLDSRRDNVGGAGNVYAIDSPPVAYSVDLNQDGTIDSTAGDKLYVFFGLRRGGKAYYALDVSNPDAPAFLWKIDKSSTGMGELGQSWSVPVVSYIPGYSTGGVPKPVLIFGGGYDVLKDDTATVAGADTEGRGIFIVDAITGALVWSVTPAANSATNLQSTGTSGLRFSIPASLTVLDSDGDELTDRIYAADTGGNVWRVDMPGSARPTSSQTAWRITRIAALNTSSTDSHAGDRRFFNAVDVVRTRDSYATFDALLIGSGDRENPNATNNRDRLYMLRDRQTSPYTTAAPNSSACSAGSADFRCSLPITDSGLYDASANLLQVGTAAQKAAAQTALASAKGWYVRLGESNGEKALARSLTIGGKVYFTTFSPDTGGAGVLCEPATGTGSLYELRLTDATAVEDFNNDGQLALADRSLTLGSLIPDTPAPHFGSDSKIRLLFPSGGGPLGRENPMNTNTKLPKPYGTYWYNQEY